MKSKKTIIIIALSIICVAIIISFLQKDLWDTNEDLLKEKLLSIDQSVETINLMDVTPFEWDVVYSFKPYTTKEDIYETVGYKWDMISETVNEGMNQLVFLNEGEVVCYVYGYPENNGYGIFFDSESFEGPFYMVKEREDDLIFQVERSNDLVLLSR